MKNINDKVREVSFIHHKIEYAIKRVTLCNRPSLNKRANEHFTIIINLPPLYGKTELQSFSLHSTKQCTAAKKASKQCSIENNQYSH